jgi:signal transduction histidine kinase
MIDSNILNTCYLGIQAIGESIRSVAFYSHLIPVFFALALALLVFIKAKKSILSRIFLAFTIVFSLWLLGDLITWTSDNYYLIYATWSLLVFLEVAFYLLGLYFAIVFVKKKDISFVVKLLLLLAMIVPFFITITQKSVTGFNYPVCEAFNNTFLDNYKLYLELLILGIILLYTLIPFFKDTVSHIKRSNIIVLGSMFLFLSVFGVTEYLASTTGNYELNLYSLFVIPVFLIAITYSIFSLDIFNLKIVSTYFLVFGFLILTASQLLFVNGSTDKLLTVLTLTLATSLSFFLFKNLHRESEQRIRIEKLSEELQSSKMRIEETNLSLAEANEKLKSLDKLKTEFLSLASHQLRSPLTAIKGYTSMLMAGDFGDINPKQKETVGRVFESTNHLTKVVEDLLNVSKIEQGGMQYTMAPFDFEKAAKDLATDLSVTAKNKGLKLTFETDNKSPYTVKGDMEKIRQVILNLLDNSIKYTKEGSLTVKLSKDEKTNKILWSVADTGVGIPPEIKKTLFQKFSRGEGAKMNTSGSGLGLYLAKTIIEGHKGRVWVESEGAGKGSVFFVELDAV